MAEDAAMPERKTRARAQRARRAGKSAATQAGEYVREEIDQVRDGGHGASSTKQAIAIGLSKARRDGVAVEPGASASTSTKKRAAKDIAAGRAKKATKKAAGKPSAGRPAAAKKAVRTRAKR